MADKDEEFQAAMSDAWDHFYASKRTQMAELRLALPDVYELVEAAWKNGFVDGYRIGGENGIRNMVDRLLSEDT